jgi:hypothetical protein
MASHTTCSAFVNASTKKEDSGSVDSDWNESVSGENDKDKSGRDGNGNKRKIECTTAAMELRPIRLIKSDASYDIIPLALSETMGSLLKRAQDDKNHAVFRRFTKVEHAAFQAGTKLLYVQLVKKGYVFEKSKFTPFSVEDVYKMTDDDPLCLGLYMKDKDETPVSFDDMAFFE